MGRTDVEVARLVGCHRETVAKYRNWAESEGLLETQLPDESTLHALLDVAFPRRRPWQQRSSLARYEDEVQRFLEQGVRMTAIAQRLEERHGVEISYEALRRLARRLEDRVPDAFVRIEVPPGSEAQVDFGYAGRQIDPVTLELRRTWVFVMVLSHSRHMYAQLVHDQTVETWLQCHVRAFEYFGGVPERIVLDNLKAAIVKNCFEDLTVQRSYRELAEHYSFAIDPNPPRQPHLKGKVEKGGVDYIKRTFLAGRDPEPTDVLNPALRTWCVERAGQRRHGTTKRRPIEVFEETERAALRPLPRTRYDMAIWKQVKLHRDCHLTFEQSYYSAPFRLVGQTLLVRGGIRTVEIRTTDVSQELVATHDRAREPGERFTCADHLPPDKVRGVTFTRENCLVQAAAIGPNTNGVVRELLDHKPEDRLRSAIRVIVLAGQYGEERLESACARALAFGAAEYPAIRNILRQGLDQEPWPMPPSPPSDGALRYARGASEYVIEAAAALLGGSR
jgi:transposase